MKPLISPCEEEVEGAVKEGHSMSRYISETAWPSRVGREAGEELSRNERRSVRSGNSTIEAFF